MFRRQDPHNARALAKDVIAVGSVFWGINQSEDIDRIGSRTSDCSYCDSVILVAGREALD